MNAPASQSMPWRWQRVVGFFLGVIAWCWRASCRTKLIGTHHRDEARRDHPGPGGLIYVMWHEHQLNGLMGADEPRHTAMASRSADGDLMAGVLIGLSITPARGSSAKNGQDKGGKHALALMEQAVLDGSAATLTVDGPRGPRRVPKPGAFALALRTGRPIVPTIALCASPIVFKRSWDQFQVPLPFSRCVLAFGPALIPSGDIERDRDELLRRMDSLERDAQQALVSA